MMKTKKDRSNPYTAQDAWIDSLVYVLEYGNESAPRGKLTKEIISDNIVFDMNYPICYHQERELSYKFMAAEAYWITSGSMFVEDIAPYNAHISQFSDDGYIFNGAYGPKFQSQLQYVVNSLLHDIDSRQAVLTIWTQNPMRSKDIACTVALQFIIRDEYLHTIVTMRSNDLWLGRPYDMFNFTIMSLRVLTELNSRWEHPVYKLGQLYLNTGSAHLYEPNYHRADRVTDVDADKETSRVPEKALYSWSYVANSLLACRDQNEEAIITHGLWRIRP